ncbi:hypothetical protein [Kitasatospora sp. NPDC088134]|uniref:hypothetical protein n=1 Tax=Kitasatospora sp. NPDC088134 TaxID=3364071 RepID=UPI00383073C2
MLRGGWREGIRIIRALAHGHVSDDHRPHPCSCSERLTVGCGTLADYGPPGLAALQAGFGGDVRAAARAFLARAIPGQSR